MVAFRRVCAALIAMVSIAASDALADVKITGSLAPEVRLFPDPPQFPGQRRSQLRPSLAAEAKLSVEPLGETGKLSINPYYRYDIDDGGRSIFDLHEAKVEFGGDGRHVKVGYDVEFWGVMEFVNPVNILNQRDITEDVTGRRRLGQPMADLSLATSFGTLDLYALEFFQPMKFPDSKGRVRPSLPINDGDNRYESGSGRNYPEFAARFAKQIDSLSAAVSYFHGYLRDPNLSLQLTPTGEPFLIPGYQLEHQAGLELQLTTGNLILKTEDVLRLNSGGSYNSYATAVGIEYDLAPLLQTRSSVTFLCEYIRDSRTDTLIVPFTNDLFAGMRVGLNDKRSTELTVWSNFHFPSVGPELVVVDASTRITDNFKLIAGLRQVLTDKGPLADISRDSYLSFKMVLYF